jgi:uncharacterized membrane protein
MLQETIWQKMRLTAKQVKLLAENNYIASESDLEKEFVKADKRSDEHSWKKFLSFNLILIAILLLLAGVIFFVAANWKEIDYFIKLAILISAVAITSLIGGILGLSNIKGKMLVLLSCLLIGPSLALFGQIYQTGADTYQLFLGWAILITPFLILNYFSGLLFFWIFLFNLSFIMWSNVFLPYFPELIQTPLVFVLPLGNLALLLLWEFGYYKKISLTNSRIVARLLGILFLLPSFISITYLILFDNNNFVSQNLIYLIYLVFFTIIAVTFLIYLHSNLVPDLTMVSLEILLIASLLCILFGRFIFAEYDITGAEGFLLQGIIILLITAGSIKIIQLLQNRINNLKELN